MPYADILSRRIPYDINGSYVSYRQTTAYADSTMLNNFLTFGSWLSDTAVANLNSYKKEQSWGQAHNQSTPIFWIFFPNKVNVTHMTFVGNYAINYCYIQGSSDTTNGTDGTWINGTFTYKAGNASTSWREHIFTCTFSNNPIKAIRFTLHGVDDFYLYHAHVYGYEVDDTPEDILFCDTSGIEFTALMDWKDRPEGTDEIKTFKLKNKSTTKSANTINLSIALADFSLSLDQLTWTSSIDIPSLAADTLSDNIYIKNTIGAHPQTLGLRSSRIVATIGSWT